MKHKGEVLPFGIFAGIALVGFVLSFGIRGESLEAEGWSEDESEGDEGKELHSSRGVCSETEGSAVQSTDGLQSVACVIYWYALQTFARRRTGRCFVLVEIRERLRIIAGGW